MHCSIHVCVLTTDSICQSEALVDHLLLIEGIERAREKSAKKVHVFIAHDAVVCVVVPYLHQTPDIISKSKSKSDCPDPKLDRKCAYYAAYFVYALQHVDTREFDHWNKSGLLPEALRGLLDRAEFCKFFKKLLMCKPISKDALASLEAELVFDRLAASKLFEGDTMPAILSIPTFEHCERDPSLIAVEHMQWPTLEKDLARVRAFRAAGPGATLPVLLFDAVEYGQGDHWVGCFLWKNADSNLVVICGDSFYNEPQRDLLEKLVEYIQKKKQHMK